MAASALVRPDPDYLCFEGIGEFRIGKLAALVGVKDLRGVIVRQLGIDLVIRIRIAGVRLLPMALRSNFFVKLQTLSQKGISTE